MSYGKLPEIIGDVCLPSALGANLLYLPIKSKRSREIQIPHYLKEHLWPIVHRLVIPYVESRRINIKGVYIYLSFEHSWIESGKTQKRPGWHSDGFMTDDLNFIAYSCCPTVFCGTKFNIKEDHKISMEQFEEQAKIKDCYIYRSHKLLALDQYCVHRASSMHEAGERKFLKISVSKDKYNLEGNSRNPLLPETTEWKFYPRKEIRNHPVYREVDSVPDHYEMEKKLNLYGEVL